MKCICTLLHSYTEEWLVTTQGHFIDPLKQKLKIIHKVNMLIFKTKTTWIAIFTHVEVKRGAAVHQPINMVRGPGAKIGF